MTSASSPVQRLSASKQRRSLGEIKKAEKAKLAANRKIVRTTVVNPNDLDWPYISDEDETKLIGCLTSDLQCLQFPNYHIPLSEIRKVEKGDRRRFRNIWCTKKALEAGFDVAHYTNLRTDLCIGVNCVSVALEQGNLVGVIIEKEVDPEILTKLLVPLATSKAVPLVAVSGLKETCRKVFKTRCLALGLKAKCEEPGHTFNRIFQLIIFLSTVKVIPSSPSVVGYGATKVVNEVFITPSSSQSKQEQSDKQNQHLGTKQKRSFDDGSPKTSKSSFKPPKLRKV